MGSTQNSIAAKKKKITDKEDYMTRQRLFLETILLEKELVRNVLQKDFCITRDMIIDVDYYTGDLNIDDLNLCDVFFHPECFALVKRKLQNRSVN